MTTRESILRDVRRGLGREAGTAAPKPPAVRIRIPEVPMDVRIARMIARVDALAGKAVHFSTSAEAIEYVSGITRGQHCVASNEPWLSETGVTSLPGVETGITNVDQLRNQCAVAAYGITSATYALSDTGTLVMIASPEEARLISLVPPAHIAIVPVNRLLSGLDELFALQPMPADGSSSMVLITGPSRTADIEQILVRGVHGPGEVHVVLVG